MSTLRKTTRRARVSRRSKVSLPWYKRVSVFFMRPPRRKVLRKKANRKRSGNVVLRRDEPTPTVGRFIEPPVQAPLSTLPVLWELFVPMIPSPQKIRFLHPAREKYFQRKPNEELIRKDLTARVEIHGHMAGDLDNLLKPILDLLKGSVIEDDRQIKAIVAVHVPHSDLIGYYVRLKEYERPAYYFK